jgi:integrase
MAKVVEREKHGKLKWIIDYYDQFGQRHKEVGGKTKKEAETKLAEILLKIKKKQYRSKRDAPTFEAVAEEWLATEASADQKGLGTVAAYRNHVKHLKEFFSPAHKDPVKVTEIDTRMIQRYLTWAREHGGHGKRKGKGISRYLANKTATTLGTILGYAVRNSDIDHNPAREVKKLVAPPHDFEDSDHEAIDEQDVYTPEEIRTLLDQAPAFYKPLLTTAVLTGARQGELLALKWSSVDWHSQQLSINRSLGRQRRDGELVFNRPKTKAGKRRVDMAPELVAVLKEWSLFCPRRRVCDTCQARTTKLTCCGTDTRLDEEALDLIFPSPTGHVLSHGNMLRQGYYPAQKNMRRLPFHSLRHFFASMQLSAGEPLAYVSRQLGHASPEITLRVYTHWLKGDGDGAAARLGQRLFSPRFGDKVGTGLGTIISHNRPQQGQTAPVAVEETT